MPIASNLNRSQTSDCTEAAGAPVKSGARVESGARVASSAQVVNGAQVLDGALRPVQRVLNMNADSSSSDAEDLPTNDREGVLRQLSVIRSPKPAPGKTRKGMVQLQRRLRVSVYMNLCLADSRKKQGRIVVPHPIFPATQTTEVPVL
jgi:hypothetical protein